MQKKELKLLFYSGYLKKAFATPSIMNDGFYLNFIRQDKQHIIMASQRASEQVFSSADPVISTARRIGFQQIEFMFI